MHAMSEKVLSDGIAGVVQAYFKFHDPITSVLTVQETIRCH